MISVFNGRSRSLGGGGVQQDIYVQVSVKMRGYLHLFKGAELAVFMAIALHSDENGFCYPSVDLIARETGYNPRTVAFALASLRELTIDGARVLASYHRYERGRRTSNGYLIFPSVAEIEETETSKTEKRLPVENGQIVQTEGMLQVEKASSKKNNPKPDPYIKKKNESTFNVVADPNINKPKPPIQSDFPGPVREVIDLTGDRKSAARFVQLYEICEENDRLTVWDKAAEATAKALGKGAVKGPPGAYFNGTVGAMLGKRGVYVPVGAADEREAVQAEIAASLFGGSQ